MKMTVYTEVRSVCEDDGLYRGEVCLSVTCCKGIIFNGFNMTKLLTAVTAPGGIVYCHAFYQITAACQVFLKIFFGVQEMNFLSAVLLLLTCFLILRQTVLFYDFINDWR